MPFSLFLALKYLKPCRSVLSVVTVVSVLGVLIGVAILVIVLSVMTGFDNMWREKILSFKPHITVTSQSGEIHDEEDLCARIERLPGIRGAAPVIETLALMQSANGMSAPYVLGIDPDRASRISRISEFMVAGKGAFSLEGKSAVLGMDLARQLGLNSGSHFLLYSPRNVVAKDELYLPDDLTVSGLFDMGMRDFDSRFVVTSIEMARDLLGMADGAHAIYVMTDDAFRFERYAAEVRRELGPEFFVRSWKDVDTLLFAALSNEKAMMFALLVFITVVAIFCVTNTLLVVTVQKTNEIGLLKALGFSSWRIMAAFVWHGWIQCLIGTLAGMGAGLVILHHLTQIVGFLARLDVNVFPKEIYGLGEIPWAISGWDMFTIGAFVMVFCTFSSLIPACRAAWLHPVEALRQE